MKFSFNNLTDYFKKYSENKIHNQELGYLSELFKINDKSINGIVSFLTKEIGHQKPNSVMYETEKFEQGKIAFNKPTLVQKIKQFRSNFISKEQHNFLKI